MIALALVLAAWAAPAVVVARAPAAVGEAGEVEILASANPSEREPPRVEVDGGEVLGLTMAGPGHWRAALRVLQSSGATVRVVGADGTRSSVLVEVARGLPCVLAPTPAEAEPRVSPGSVTGRVYVRFPLRSTDVGCAARVVPDRLLVRASEGRVGEVHVVDSVLEVGVDVAADRIARNVLVAVLEAGVPGVEPVIGTVALHGRPSLAVQAEAASLATVKVGRRTFGPFLANDLGTIDATLETLPGDASYEITVTDSVGNTRRATGPLPSARHAAVVVVEDGGGRAGWIAARTPAGASGLRAADGAPDALPRHTGTTRPRCTASSGGRVPVLPARAPGLWRVPALGEGLPGFDLLYGCEVEDVHVELRVPSPPPVPARIELRAYPEVLSSDVPVGQVVATLVTADGLPAAFLPAAMVGAPTLAARHGDLLTEGAPVGQARASYRGEDARAFGEDLVTAAWSRPPVASAAWTLDVQASGRGATVEVRARVLAANGAPVEGLDVDFLVGGSLSVPDTGTVVRGRTDARGWVTVEGPLGEGVAIVIARVPSVGLEARRVVVPGEIVILPPSDRPDLETSLVVPIRAGRVREIVIATDAREVRRGDAVPVSVELRDANGGRVTDEPVRLVASEGGAVALARGDDGTWRGSYVALQGEDPASVTLEASSGDVRAETVVAVVPRPYRGAASVALGLRGDASRAVLVGAASVAARGPGFPEALALRASASLHEVRRSVDDLVTGGAIDVRATVLTLDLGAEVVRRFGRTNVALGGGAAFAPYQLVVDYDGRRGTEGAGVTGPGAVARTRLGYRLGAAEVYSELAWTFLGLEAPSVRFDGGVGGTSVVAGYRLSW